MYKIIFIDIDGTLRNDKKEITDRTKVAIHKIVEKGIPVVICSGRPRQYTKKVSQEALASNYIIVCNGGEIPPEAVSGIRRSVFPKLLRSAEWR